MTRFIVLQLAFVACVSPALAESEPAPDAARPNILFLMADDMRADWLSCAGHWVQTPNLDRLAAKGTRFTRGYTTNPVCQPSRATFLTGQAMRTHRCGFSSNHKLTSQQWANTYPGLLRTAGYHTGFIGKFGVQQYAFDASQQFDFWMAHDGWAMFIIDKKKYSAYAGTKASINNEIMAEGAERFLAELPADKPFCLSISLSSPHGSSIASHGSKIEQKELLGTVVNELKDHPFYGYLYRNQEHQIPAEACTDPYQFFPKEAMDQAGRMKVYSYDYEMPSLREHYVRYGQQVTGLDHSVGRIMNELERRGLSDNTIIVFSSDHGLLMGEYGMGGKGLLYELTAKVPYIVYDPRSPARGQVLDHYVLNTDLAPTVLDWAGVAIPEQMEGRSFRRLVDGQTEAEWRDDLFLESLFTLRDTPFAESVTLGDWKYIRHYPSPGGRWNDSHLGFNEREPVFELLHNLEDDPGEMRNRIQDPEAAEVLATLRQRCAEESARADARRAAFDPSR